jgi:hypothetical protein
LEKAQLFGYRFRIVSDMKIELPPISEAERTPLVLALLATVDLQQQRIQVLDDTGLQLRNEIAMLKGQKPRPTIGP